MLPPPVIFELTRIILTSGEPAGIGPDLCLSIAARDWSCDLVVAADTELLSERARQLGLSVRTIPYEADTERVRHVPGSLRVLHRQATSRVRPGQLDVANSPYVLALLDAAIDGCMHSEFDAMVTAPVQIIGAWNPRTHIFRWGWDHPMVVQRLRNDAERTRWFGDKHDLGIHTEMFSDGVVPLAEAGVITNRYKALHPGRTVTSFINGTRRLYDFVDDNPLVEFHPCDRTNDVALVRMNDRVVAINSAIEIDLTGQVCADSIGHTIFSGIGGQMDFIRGAALSPGGKPIIALPSLAMGGRVSRIVPQLTPGAGVVTTRGHVHWVITEYGAVNLHGKTLRERGEELISIAHPDFRAELRADLANRRHFTLS